MPIGRNTRSSPAPAPRIVDEAAFTAWIEEHYPDQVEIKKTVRAPFKKRFTTDPLGQHVLGPNSEVDPPGLAVGQREPSASTTADLNMIRELWLSGQTDEIQAVMADAMRGLVLGQLPSGEVPQ